MTYDSHPVPLTTKLKYRLAFKSATDPMTFVGVAFIAAIYQAGDIPDYQQGWKGYGQRFGAGLADTTTDIFFGGAILPSLLHQDPRYFYQGTGTTKSVPSTHSPLHTSAWETTENCNRTTPAWVAI